MSLQKNSSPRSELDIIDDFHSRRAKTECANMRSESQALNTREARAKVEKRRKLKERGRQVPASERHPLHACPNWPVSLAVHHEKRVVRNENKVKFLTFKLCFINY